MTGNLNDDLLTRVQMVSVSESITPTLAAAAACLVSLL